MKTCLSCNHPIQNHRKYCSQECCLKHKWGSVEKRFWGKVQFSRTDECWEWSGVRDKNGYGLFSNFRHNGKREQRANRISWILSYGSIPNGEWVLHRCDNPPCCNPHHLFLGDAMENMQDKMRKGRYKCPKGEEHYRSQIGVEDVREIRRLHQAGIPQRKIASLFKMGFKNVHKIVHFQRWQHV